MMREEEGRIENEANVSNFGGQINCYTIHKVKANVEEQVLVREYNKFRYKHVKFEKSQGNL